MESADGREWMDELAQGGFEDYYSGKMPPPPDWAMTPETAPRIGDRVRIVGLETTLAGVAFKDGELAIVSEMKLAPLGAVFVTLRTLDGRMMLTGAKGSFVPG
jgi:hypothetical protein